MSELPTALDEDLKKAVVNEFYAIEIILPTRTIRLIDGAGFVRFDSGSGEVKFSGKDDIYGVLDGSDALRDGFGDNASAFGFSILPATDGAIAALVDPANQMSPVKVWVGTRNAATNAVIGVSKRFDGFLDFAVLEADEKGLLIDIECVTWQEQFFRTREGITLSNAHHQSNWPGETGLSFVTGIQRTIIWGPGDRPGNVVYAGGGGGGGGLRGVRPRYDLE